MRSDQQEPGLDAEIAFLRRPEAWPGRPERVEVIETHLSFVFLAGDEVYKLKKPLLFDQQDLRSVEARRRSCETEVRLNQRLAPDVYLGTVPLAIGRDGQLSIGRAGSPVDWLVRMRRLPADRFLDAAIRSGTVDPERLRDAARLLARFHLRQPPASRDGREYVRGLAQQIVWADEHLGGRSVDCPRELVDPVRDALIGWLESHAEPLRARVAAGRVVEGHGDLRPEHVCLLPRPVVIDCLEFDVRLRTLDSVDELGYLALECERLGAAEVGRVFLDTWRAESHERVPAGLIAFHQAMRAFTRAALPALRLQSHAPRDEGLVDHLQARMRSYLRSAAEKVQALETAP